MTNIVMIVQILQNATMMEVIVVDLMSTQNFVLNVSAMFVVVITFTGSEMVGVMTRQTMRAAILMEVTVVDQMLKPNTV